MKTDALNEEQTKQLEAIASHLSWRCNEFTMKFDFGKVTFEFSNPDPDAE